MGVNNILGSKQILFLTVLVVLAVSVTGSAYADTAVGGKPLETVQEGNVTGDLAADSYYGFNATDPCNVTYTFNYTIPSNAKIKNATLYVLVYSGNMQEARQTYVNVTYNGYLLDNQTLNTTYTYPPEGNNNTWLLGPGHDHDPYLMVNKHTMRVTSDYLLWYDVTNKTNESNWANVCTKGSYDGRIKLITLVVAYNLPGSTNATRYWINFGHDVSSYNDENYTGETYFNGAVPNPKSATLMIIHAASQDGIYTYNNQSLPNGTYQRRGSYSGYEIWNVTNFYNNGTNRFTYHKSAGTGLAGYYKIILAIQKVTYTPNIDLKFQSVLVPGGTTFALENNTITCVIRNNGTGISPPTKLLLYANDDLVANATIPSINPNSNVYVNITDPTIRPATPETLYGNNNQNVTYRLFIDPDNEVPEADETNNQYTKTVPILYNGYKGKRWAYNGSDFNTIETYDGQYGLAYYAQPDTTYMSGTNGWSNYTVIFNGTQPSIPENAIPVKAYLYVPYNWDNKGIRPEEGAATTYLTIQFNEAVFQPGNYTRWYWDQSNFGGYPNYKYGLLVYNVTQYYKKNQDNIINVTLSVPASSQTHTLSMYPFTLLVIYKDANSPRRQIYIAEESDVLLLGSTYGTTLDETIAYTTFSGPEIDLENVANATYHTWAGNAGPNEGNVYFNNETLGLNAWHGNSQTAYPEIFNVTGKLQANNNKAAIQGTDSGGMLALLQILVVEYKFQRDLKVANITYNPSNAAGHRELFANEPNTIKVTIYNEGNLDAGQFKVKLTIGNYTNTKTLQGLVANSTANVTFDDFTPTTTGPINITVTVDSDNEVEETNETNNIYETNGTVYYNGYKGKRYTGGNDINTVLFLEGRLGLLYSCGNSTYRGSGSSNWQTPYTVTWTPTDLPIPEGATVKEARLYQPYTWNTALGIPDFTATFNQQTINPVAHYNDTKGYGTSNYPSGLIVYNVTSLFNANENNTLILTAGTNTTTALYGSYLLIIYEHENETTKKIWINEETDMLYSKTDYGVNDTEATAYANFNLNNINMLKNATTIIIMASANEANKSKFYFNNNEYTGFWQDYLTGPQIGFSKYQIKEAIQAGENIARIQSYNNGSNGDNMVALQSILILEYEPPKANFTANTTKGTAPLTVQFTDLSTGATEWQWDFNNDTIIDSTEQNPTYTYTQPGTYTVTLTVKGPGGQDTLTKQDYITVYKGPAFELGNLTVTPTSGLAPLNVTITCNVANTGDIQGNYTAQLKINGGVVDTQTVTVGAGETKTVTFTRTLARGTYNVTVDDLSPVVVRSLAPANITVSKLNVTPTSGMAPLNVTITCDVANTGDIQGNYTVTLKVNGQVVADQAVMVPANAVRTVEFRYTLVSPGNYTLAIGGLSAIVTVKSAGVNIAELVRAASTVKAYYKRYGRLPVNVTISGRSYSMAQLLYLLCKATVNIDAGNLAAIMPRFVGAAPRPNGSYGHGNIYRSEYVRVAKNIIGFIEGKGRAPNYAWTSLGRIPFPQIVYMYGKIIVFYGSHGRLPRYVYI